RCLVWSFDRRTSVWNPFLYEKKAIWPGGQMTKKRKRRKRDVEIQNINLSSLANALLEIVHRLKGQSQMKKGDTIEKFSRLQEILQIGENVKQNDNNSSMDI